MGVVSGRGGALCKEDGGFYRRNQGGNRYGTRIAVNHARMESGAAVAGRRGAYVFYASQRRELSRVALQIFRDDSVDNEAIGKSVFVVPLEWISLISWE